MPHKSALKKRPIFFVSAVFPHWHICCCFLKSNAGRRLYSKPKGGEKMLNWSITFLVIGLIAGVLGFSGVAGAATQIAWILFVIFLVLFVVSLVMGRGGPPT